ncbi:hypothetical protein Ancab_013327 [Ancistrocladus abbreviatus]
MGWNNCNCEPKSLLYGKEFEEHGNGCGMGLHSKWGKGRRIRFWTIIWLPNVDPLLTHALDHSTWLSIALFISLLCRMGHQVVNSHLILPTNWYLANRGTTIPIYGSLYGVGQGHNECRPFFGLLDTANSSPSWNTIVIE